MDSDEEEDLEELYERATQGDIDLDEIMVSAAYAGKPKGVAPNNHLSKIWKIDFKTAVRTLEVVFQGSKRTWLASRRQMLSKGFVKRSVPRCEF